MAVFECPGCKSQIEIDDWRITDARRNDSYTEIQGEKLQGLVTYCPVCDKFWRLVSLEADGQLSVSLERVLLKSDNQESNLNLNSPDPEKSTKGLRKHAIIIACLLILIGIIVFVATFSLRPSRDITIKKTPIKIQAEVSENVNASKKKEIIDTRVQGKSREADAFKEIPKDTTTLEDKQKSLVGNKGKSIDTREFDW